MGVDRGATGMGDEGGARGGLEHVERRRLVRMAEVDGDAVRIHGRHRLVAQVGQPTLGVAQHAGAERRGLVVCQLHHPHAQIAEQFDAVDLAIDCRDLFEGKHDAEPPGALALREVGMLAHLREYFGIFLEDALEEGEFRDRVLEIVVEAADRRLDGGDARLAHGVEHGFRKGEFVLQRRVEVRVEHHRAGVKVRGFVGNARLGARGR
jgi:hypothetical protein